MTAQTRLSAKGQVVIPKDVRDRLGWLQGSELEVVETGDGVLLRKKSERKKLTVDEALARLRQLVHYRGPPLPIERLSWSAEVDREFEQSKK
jgi:AbrB family looped-hinge helix DNA binding protein